MFQPDSEVLKVLLQRAVEESASLVVITDPGGLIRYVNRGFEETTGYRYDEVVGQNIRLLKSGRQGVETYRDLWSTVLEGRTWRGFLHNRRKDGTLYWARATIDPVRDEAGGLRYFIAIQEDVTREFEKNRALATRANHLEVLSELGHVALGGADIESLASLAAESVCRVLGGARVTVSLADSSNRLLRRLAGPTGELFEPGSREDDAWSWIHIPIPGDPAPHGALVVALPCQKGFTEQDGWFLDGVAAVLGTAMRRMQDEERIRRLAQRDPLTGLYNRRVLAERAQDVMAQARRGGFKAAVLFVDLDRFKEVNDTLGHAAGDELLAKVARRLQRSLRRGETLARVGGDEFAFLLAPVREAEPEKAAQRLLARLLVPFRVHGRRVQVSASIGVALFPDDGEDLDALLRRADHAMYRVKAGGGAGVACMHVPDSTSTG